MTIYDSADGFYKSPFGAVSSGETVSVSLSLPERFSAAQVELILFADGQEENVFLLEQKAVRDGAAIFGCSFDLADVGIYRYYFRINSGERLYVKKIGDSTLGEINDGSYGGLWQLTVYDAAFTVPQDMFGSVMYQIFPDRFYRSGKDHSNIPPERALRSDWGSTPYWLPSEDGPYITCDYFGGDLAGIAEKLPYLQSLGVGIIYLNPIFEAHSNHRYNTADYFKIDPLLGTERDFIDLCAKAKKMSVKIILDGVFAHTGSDSVYFNREGRYGNCGAYNDPLSPCCEWYEFENYPDQYKSWWGFKTLPRLSSDSAALRNFFCGEGGVIDHWLSRGASGFRLDVADELSDGFIEQIRTAVKRNGHDKLLIGEVWEDASTKESYGVLRKYLLGHELDSVMNYPFRSAIFDYIKGGDCYKFKNTVMAILENYPKHSVNLLMNSLSTHDTPRAITALAGDEQGDNDRDWQSHHALSFEQYAKGAKMFKLATVLQFFLPGIPCVYYGDEAGMQGYSDPFNRGCFPWGHEDKELTRFIQKLSTIRKDHGSLGQSRLRFLPEEKIVAFTREEIAVAVNPTDLPQPLTSPEFEGEILAGSVTNGAVEARGCVVVMTIDNEQ
ncbi:MAG: glycoside hydrolase family 13 protein [Oscillospiraceae bacterium]|nr:glycoside hydrolase family 13 protein [Oscillospiraceae bacterium]